MSDTDLRAADPQDPMSKVAFEGPAVLAERFLVSERDLIVRISVAETDLGGQLHFRGAVAMPLQVAEELSQVLATIVSNAKARGA